MAILAFVNLILGVVQRVESQAEQAQTALDKAKAIYAQLQLLFPGELPDKTDEEIAQLGLDGFEANLAEIAAERARLAAKTSGPQDPPPAPEG